MAATASGGVHKSEVPPITSGTVAAFPLKREIREPMQTLTLVKNGCSVSPLRTHQSRPSPAHPFSNFVAVSTPWGPISLSYSSIHHSSSRLRANVLPKSRANSPAVFASVAGASPAKALRLILESPGVHLGPSAFDALSAKLIERAGFDYCFMGGFGMVASRLGLPDVGLISYGEVVDHGQQITQAVSIPVIGDGDNGYGNAMNVKRTVKGFITAGFAGIILDDQVSPKECGHGSGTNVVSREEAMMRIKAAINARTESGSDIVIVARTASRQAVSFDESLWRAQAFADAGADVLFIDELASKEEMKVFCETYPLVPKLGHMLEGGRTPILSQFELEDVGYKLVAYPLTLMAVSIRAMQDALTAIKGGRIPSPGSMTSLQEIKDILGFNSYYEEEKQYATSTSQQSSQSVSSNAYGIPWRAQDDPAEQKGQSPQDPVVELITPEVYNNYGADGSKVPFSGIWSRKLRVKITGRDGFEKLDVQIPAGFLEGITNIVPALGGVNIKALLDDAALEVGGKQLLDFKDRMGDRIQVFLE